MGEIEAGPGRTLAASRAWADGDVAGALGAERSYERCIAVTPGAQAFDARVKKDLAKDIETALKTPGHAIAVAPLRTLLAQGGVLDQLQAEPLTHPGQLIQPRRVPVRVHHDQSAHRTPGVPVARSVQQRLEIGGELVGVHAEGGFLAVHKVRNGPGVRDGIHGADEGEGRHQHLVPGLDPGQSEAGVEGDGAVGHRDGPAGSRERGELLLEAIHQLCARRLIAEEQVAALPEPGARRAAAHCEAPIELLPEADAVLDHPHGDRRAELLADAAHRAKCRGVLVCGIALDDGDAAGETVFAQVERRARSDDRAADDNDVGACRCC